jgi:hypothetical protein
MGMGRWRVGALILAVLAFGSAALGMPTWLPGGLSLHAGQKIFFWLGVVCFLVAMWGRPGT